MKELTQVEGNKLIAEFMGGKHNGGSYYNFYNGLPIQGRTEKEYPAEWIETDLHFHSSWDWLMPVVEKIESMDNRAGVRLETRLIAHTKINARDMMTPIYCYTFGITFNQHEKFSVDAESKISAVWHGVIQFIQWYNENKPK